MPFRLTLPKLTPPRRPYQSVTLHFLRWLWGQYREQLTRAGRWFFWATLLFAGYGALSLEVQAYVLFCYAFSLWCVAVFLASRARPRVQLQVEQADRVCAGEVMPVEIMVRRLGGRSGTDLHVVPHRLPGSVEAIPPSGAHVAHVGPGEKERARMGLRCGKRGVYRLRGHRVQTSWPLHLVFAQQFILQERQLVVYPRFTPLAGLQIQAGRRYQPGGVALASSMGEAFEYVGNREYRHGDNIRTIDWRATARLGRPIVREYREEYFLRVGVILDTQVPRAPRALREARRESFEQAVSLCASVSDFMARQEYIVDVFAAGPSLYHLTAGRSLAYLDQILDILACVEETETEPFEVIEPELLEHLSRITTIVCVFLDWNETRRAFALRLLGHGTALKVIIVRDGEPSQDPEPDTALFGPIPILSREDLARGIEEL